jgi:small subunit ribosomal protein S16
MLVIRMQRTGRKGHAMFRIVVQDSRRTPTSGKVVAQLGSYDPHAKNLILDKEKAAFYLEHGSQPSERVARLLKNEGVKLPEWVQLSADKERTVRHADKRRSTTPPAPVEETPEAPVAEAPAEEPASPEAEATPVE